MAYNLDRYNRSSIIILVGVLIVMLSSCASYRQHVMFATETEIIPENMSAAVYEAEKNYVIKINDYVNIQVYTNGGERIIDPDYELLKETGIQGNQQLNRPNPDFLVQEDGMVKLPMIGLISLQGLTLRQADLVLQEQYSQFYNDPYVITRYVNKRVVIIGATESVVVPLRNENTTLVEVLALAGGIIQESKAQNIRLIRGPLNNPEVYIIDLSTVSGMTNSIKQILPGDIIYIEPVVRPFTEAARDIAPIASLITSTVALIISLQILLNQ